MPHDNVITETVFSSDSKIATTDWDHICDFGSATFNQNGTQLVTLSEENTVRTLQVPSSLPDDTQWVPAYIEVISGWKADSDTALHRMTFVQNEEAWREVLKSPTWLELQRQESMQRARAWHETEARDDEATKRWFAAVFHLRLLCQQEPSNVDFQNRLRHAINEERRVHEVGETRELCHPPMNCQRKTHFNQTRAGHAAGRAIRVAVLPRRPASNLRQPALPPNAPSLLRR